MIQRQLTFTVSKGEVFIIMGENGYGKSTLMEHTIGLLAESVLQQVRHQSQDT